MSTLVAQTISNGVVSTSSANVIQGSAKAWVNFNGNTGAINQAFNVSSVTRNGAGIYTVTFTTAMSNTNYAVVTGAPSYGLNSSYSGTLMVNNGGTYTTSAVQMVYGFGNAPNLYDTPFAALAVFN